MAKIHRVKCASPWFEDVEAGRKPFELRKDDRDYQVGDIMYMVHVDADGKEDEDHFNFRKIIYKLAGPFQDGLAEGWCVLGVTHNFTLSDLGIIHKHLNEDGATADVR